jgi:hypothetical protein
MRLITQAQRERAVQHIEHVVQSLVAVRRRTRKSRIDGRLGKQERSVRLPAGGGGGAALPKLHLTNGDATVPQLLATGLVDRVLPWRDVLHEGPVPNVPDTELRQVHAAFLSAQDAPDVGTAAEFAERDRMLGANRNGGYVLWLEAVCARSQRTDAGDDARHASAENYHGQPPLKAALVQANERATTQCMAAHDTA